MRRRSYFDGFLLLPTFAIYWLARPWMNAKHPWKVLPVSWHAWWHSSTDLNVAFGVCFWGIIIGLTILLYRVSF